jgi:pilus assembly protein Flp/PilA
MPLEGFLVLEHDWTIERLADAGRKAIMNLKRLILRVELLKYDVRGQDLIEYALMAGFVAVAAGAIFPTALAPGISTIFSRINSTLSLA